MSQAEAEAHQRKNGFLLSPQVVVEDAPRIVLPKNRANKTEAAFGLILEAQKRRGDILDYKFQAYTLRIGDDCRYTPDFAVLRQEQIELIEIKGGFIREDAMVKFRAAKELHGDWFDFSMWQKKAGTWAKIL